MNILGLVMRIKEKMNNPIFAKKFNEASDVVSNMPGLQQEIMRIMQINDAKAQNDAISRLPKEAKEAVVEIISLLQN